MGDSTDCADTLKTKQRLLGKDKALPNKRWLTLQLETDVKCQHIDITRIAATRYA